MDLFSPSDAYVIVSVKDASEQTRVIDDDNAPVFDESFSFDLELTEDDSVTFNVFDKDHLHDELIGSVVVPIKQAFYGRDGLRKYALLNRRGKTTGSITVHVKWNAAGIDLEDVDDLVDRLLALLKDTENPAWLKTTEWYATVKKTGAWVGGLPVAKSLSPVVVDAANLLLTKVGVTAPGGPEATEDGPTPAMVADKKIHALLVFLDGVIQNGKASIAQAALNLKHKIISAQKSDEESKGGVQAFLRNLPIVRMLVQAPEPQDA